MPRGKNAKVGSRFKSANGYWYTKQEDGRWKLDHIIVAEKVLGRPLAEGERCRYRDGNKDNLAPDNIIVVNSRKASAARRRAQLEAKIAEAQAELEALEDA